MTERTNRDAINDGIKRMLLASDITPERILFLNELKNDAKFATVMATICELAMEVPGFCDQLLTVLLVTNRKN